MDRVRSLRFDGSRATALVDGSDVYKVALDCSAAALDGTCTCLDAVEFGEFCKHLVAVGLALVGRAHTMDAPDSEAIAVGAYLGELDRDELVELIGRLADAAPGVDAALRTEAVAAGHRGAVDAAELARQVTASLPRSRFVDYRESYAVAHAAEGVLDRLEALLGAGAADAVSKALLRATTRLRSILLDADDSSGVIGAAGERAVQLYARACREGTPNRVGLARWLVGFRRDSPGWPHVELAMFVDAFDERALAEYRRGVVQWSADLDDADHYARYEVQAALVELADHDGDVDRAVELLTAGAERIPYGSVIDRVLAAGRRAEALHWLDRAVAERRISTLYGQRTDYWIPPSRAVELYSAAGRDGDALNVLRTAFVQRVGPQTWRALLDFAARLDRSGELREWAIGAAEELAGRPHGSGSDLINVYLSESRVEEAWRAAKRFGAGSAWRELAEASAALRPREAAELYRPEIEARLVHANTAAYPEVARLLADMQRLSAAAGEAARLRGVPGRASRTIRATSLPSESPEGAGPVASRRRAVRRPTECRRLVVQTLTCAHARPVWRFRFARAARERRAKPKPDDAPNGPGA